MSALVTVSVFGLMIVALFAVIGLFVYLTQGAEVRTPRFVLWLRKANEIDIGMGFFYFFAAVAIGAQVLKLILTAFGVLP